MEECCLYILKLLDSGLKLQNPMLEASRQSSNSNLIIIALSNLLLAVNPRSGNFFIFDRDFTSWSQELIFFTLHLLFPYSFWTFIPHSSLDFYFPFLFRLFSFLFHFFYQLVFNSLLIFFFFFFISFSILLLFNLGHILDFFQIFNNEKYF